MSDFPEFMNTKEAAAFLRRSTHLLNKLRVEGGGPVYSQIIPNGRVVYAKADLMAWLESRRIRSTSEGEAKAA